MLAIYCRISKKKVEGTDVSIESQTKLGVEFAKKNNFQYKIFKDEGISGNNDDIKERPDFVKLIDGIQKKEITAVYCYDQSRIARNTVIFNLFCRQLVENDVKFFPNGELVDLTQSQDKFFIGMLSLVNEFYSTITGEKVKLAININAKKGKTHGIIAYGYQRDENGYYKVNDDEAIIVKRIFELSLNGTGTYTIANILNSENIPTKFHSYIGNINIKSDVPDKVTHFPKAEVKWRGTVINGMIKNPVYKGKRRWNNEEINVPPIIDEDIWNAVNKNLTENKKYAGKNEEYNYLLNGLLYCIECGREYRGKKRLKGRDNAYKCKSKNYHGAVCESSRGLSIPKLDTFIVHHLFLNKNLKEELSKIPKNNTELIDFKEKIKNLTEELNKEEQKIKNITKILVNQSLDDDTDFILELNKAKKNKKNLNDKIQNYNNKIIEIEDFIHNNKFIKQIEKYKIDIDFNNLKLLVRSLIKKIFISHKNTTNNKGVYNIFIYYKGYDEFTVFQTDYKALKWIGKHRFRRQATNEADLKEDFAKRRELIEYFKKVNFSEEQINDYNNGIEIEFPKYDENNKFIYPLGTSLRLIKIEYSELISDKINEDYKGETSIKPIESVIEFTKNELKIF